MHGGEERGIYMAGAAQAYRVSKTFATKGANARPIFLPRAAFCLQRPLVKGNLFSPSSRRFGTQAEARKEILKITMILIAGTDRSGLSYPTLPLAGLISHDKGAATSVAQIVVNEPQPLNKSASTTAPFRQKKKFVFVQE